MSMAASDEQEQAGLPPPTCTCLSAAAYPGRFAHHASPPSSTWLLCHFKMQQRSTRPRSARAAAVASRRERPPCLGQPARMQHTCSWPRGNASAPASAAAAAAAAWRCWACRLMGGTSAAISWMVCSQPAGPCLCSTTICCSTSRKAVCNCRPASHEKRQRSTLAASSPGRWRQVQPPGAQQHVKHQWACAAQLLTGCRSSLVSALHPCCGLVWWHRSGRYLSGCSEMAGGVRSEQPIVTHQPCPSLLPRLMLPGSAASLQPAKNLLATAWQERAATTHRSLPQHRCSLCAPRHRPSLLTRENVATSLQAAPTVLSVQAAVLVVVAPVPCSPAAGCERTCCCSRCSLKESLFSSGP